MNNSMRRHGGRRETDERQLFAEVGRFPIGFRERMGLMPDVLYIHVPVDVVNITDGPGSSVCDPIIECLGDDEKTEVRDLRNTVSFTCKTGASATTFTAKIVVNDVFEAQGDAFKFNGIFAGRNVTGFYDFRLRMGWFIGV